MTFAIALHANVIFVQYSTALGVKIFISALVCAGTHWRFEWLSFVADVCFFLVVVAVAVVICPLFHSHKGKAPLLRMQ